MQQILTGIQNIYSMAYSRTVIIQIVGVENTNDYLKASYLKYVSKRSEYLNKNLYIQHVFRTQLAHSYYLAFKILRSTSTN